MGRTRSRISEFETGRKSESIDVYGQIRILRVRIKGCNTQSKINKWLNGEVLQAEADKWLHFEKSMVDNQIALKQYLLSDMKAQYTKVLRALSIVDQWHQHPEMNSEQQDWIPTIFPKIRAIAQRTKPLEQYKLYLSIEDVKGRKKAMEALG